jgi:hypothetical protein
MRSRRSSAALSDDARGGGPAMDGRVSTSPTRVPRAGLAGEQLVLSPNSVRSPGRSPSARWIRAFARSRSVRSGESRTGTALLRALRGQSRWSADLRPEGQ